MALLGAAEFSEGRLPELNAPMGAVRVTIDISGSEVSIHGLPEGMVFHRGYLPWVGDLMEQAPPASEN